MKLKAVFFDLDGTLLPMDQDKFINTYLSGLAAKLAPYGYDPGVLAKSIWYGTGAMIKNDGTRTNEQVFWDTFTSLVGEGVLADIPHFDRFYEEDFDKVSSVADPKPDAALLVRRVKNLGLIPVLATNPVFPSIATRKRTAWAGLSTDDFALFTSYENSHFCKPNPEYYKEILGKLSLDPCECLMVGNDVDEDMITEQLGMRVFLMTECLINKSGKDISVYPRGGFKELSEYIDSLLAE